MLRRSSIFAIVLLALALTHAGEVIDRLSATSTGTPFCKAMWMSELRYECSIDIAIAGVTASDRRATLDRLIDQELLQEQMRSSDFARGTDEQDVNQRMAQVQAQYAAKSEAQWKAVLAEHHVEELELKRRVAMQLDMLRLVDDRLRPTIQIDPKSIESYYQQSLLPQLRNSGAARCAVVGCHTQN